MLGTTSLTSFVLRRVMRDTLMDVRIDLVADLNDEDDEGLGWSALSDASDPARICPG